jgi:anti-anti-sigma factor
VAERRREPFRVTASEEGGGLRLRFFGEYDYAVAGEASKALAQACDRGGRVEIDLAGVTFLDSSGLRTLVTARRAADRDGCSLVLVDVSERARQVLEITGTLDWLSS